MKNAIHAQYEAGAPAGPVDRIVLSQRRKLFDAFMNFKHGSAADTTLSVGMTTGAPFDKSDYLVAWSSAQERARIHAHAIEAPGADLRLPFPDGAFDWVCCNEVIEHVGGSDRQFALVRELYRVARKGVFVSTPNRRHPIEFHTGMPLLHLLPHAGWRRILGWLGSKWPAASTLNLLDARSLYRFAAMLPGAPEHDVGHKRVFGMKAHFFLIIQKAKKDGGLA